MIRSLYLTQRFFLALSGLILLFVLGFSFSWLFALARVAFIVFVLLLVVDLLMSYRTRRGVVAHRITPQRMSNGDQNPLRIFVANHYRYKTLLHIVDELPVQFQKRDFMKQLTLLPGESQRIDYELRPVRRGVYQFGSLNVFAHSPIALVAQRYRFSNDKAVPVYPSFVQMRKYELLAISNNLSELGIKRMRRLGHNREFEQITDYVAGDDFRTINWKATARRGGLMVNKYQDERSQQVYSLIDKGRTMKMPFAGMSLLDYAINASLVISNIAIRKEDKAGLMAFQHRVQQVVPASRRNAQMNLIMEALYAQKTACRESDFEALYTQLRRHVRQRSLLLLFSNFETFASLERQLPYLRRMAAHHVLVVVLFKNTELYHLLDKKVTSIQEVYQKTVAEKFAAEKYAMVSAMKQHSIHAVLTTPQLLTVDTINKYLELKARGFI